ncbi:hypothetical protein ACROYT_G040140 [Oculina patagonica]
MEGWTDGSTSPTILVHYAFTSKKEARAAQDNLETYCDGRAKRDGLDLGRGTTCGKRSVPMEADRCRLMSHQGRRGKKSGQAGCGDRIRCTVMFENKKENDGKVQVPVMFSLNGMKITPQVGEDPFFLDSDRPLYPYIGMREDSSVLAKDTNNADIAIDNATARLT